MAPPRYPKQGPCRTVLGLFLTPVFYVLLRGLRRRG
jgi:hypothetical protein